MMGKVETANEMAKESSSISMAPSMKVNGKMTNDRATASFQFQMSQLLKVIGIKINLKIVRSILIRRKIRTSQCLEDNLLMANLLVMVISVFSMEIVTKVHSKMDSDLGLERWSTKIYLAMKE